MSTITGSDMDMLIHTRVTEEAYSFYISYSLIERIGSCSLLLSVTADDEQPDRGDDDGRRHPEFEVAPEG